MKDYQEEIKKEARAFAEIHYLEEEHPKNFNRTKNGFIAGVNSKIAQRIKIEFAIEQLNNAMLSSEYNAIGVKIEELQQQLEFLNKSL